MAGKEHDDSLDVAIALSLVGRVLFTLCQFNLFYLIYI